MKTGTLPSAKDTYYAAFLGAAAGYFGFVLLIGISVAVAGSNPAELFNVLLMGLVVGPFPAFLVCTLIVAPIAVFLALKPLGWLAANRFHGLVTGMLTAIVLFVALATLGGSEFSQAPDAGTIAFLSGALIIAAFCGGIAQRWGLRWDEQPQPQAQSA